MKRIVKIVKKTNNMKKITMSVAALSIAISGFCTNPPTNEELVKEISLTTEDMIQSMRMGILEDKFKGFPVDIAEIYVHNLLDVLSKLEDIQMNLSHFDCENCDEID
tara:strand:- start:531 stop:851 length:321 start_codon:yes stop_codon:yes gene_type:complete